MTATGLLRRIGVSETCDAVTFSIALEVSLARARRTPVQLSLPLVSPLGQDAPSHRGGGKEHEHSRIVGSTTSS
jgi:hypothetical protein